MRRSFSGGIIHAGTATPTDAGTEVVRMPTVTPAKVITGRRSSERERARARGGSVSFLDTRNNTRAVAASNVVDVDFDSA
jgi:hypothetical protein